MTLSWLPGDAWHMVSACGKYTVTKAGTPAKTIYLAWRRPITEKNPACMLGHFDTSREAKEAAQLDAEGKWR